MKNAIKKVNPCDMIYRLQGCRSWQPHTEREPWSLSWTWGSAGGAQRWSSIGFISVPCSQASRETIPEHPFCPVFLLVSFPSFLCALFPHWKSTCRHRRGGEIFYVKVDMLSSKKMSQPLKPRGSSGSQPARRGRQRMTHWVIGGQDGETVGQREGSQGGWGSNPDSAPDWVLFTLPLSSQVKGQRWRLHFCGLMATLANIGMPNLCWAKAIKKILFDMLHFHFIQLMYLLFSIENSSLSRELYRSTNSASANVKEVTITLFLYYYFWPHHMTCRIQNLSSLTRDRTYTPCRGSMES